MFRVNNSWKSLAVWSAMTLLAPAGCRRSSAVFSGQGDQTAPNGEGAEALFDDETEEEQEDWLETCRAWGREPPASAPEQARELARRHDFSLSVGVDSTVRRALCD